MKLSIIIPTLDEADVIVATLTPLQSLRRAGHEVVLADGGSRDATTMLAAPLVDKLLRGPRGRARQMNAGAGAASGDWLLLLHADTLLPAHVDEIMFDALAHARGLWGRFDVRLSGVQTPLRVIEATMNLRSRVARLHEALLRHTLTTLCTSAHAVERGGGGGPRGAGGARGRARGPGARH